MLLKLSAIKAPTIIALSVDSMWGMHFSMHSQQPEAFALVSETSD